MDKPKTTTIDISASLAKATRRTARQMKRTPEAQFEIWTRIGQIAEKALSYDSIVRLMTLAQLPEVDRLLARAGSPEGRKKLDAAVDGLRARSRGR